MTNNKTQSATPVAEGSDAGEEVCNFHERKLKKTFVARWKASKGAKRAFVAAYNRSCALGGMLFGMAEGLLKFALRSEEATKEKLTSLNLWQGVQENHRSSFVSFIAVRVEEARNRRLDEDRSPTAWGERAERKTHLSGFFGTLRDIPVERTTEGPNGEKVVSEEIRMGRILPEELQKLHAGQMALLGPARATIADLMAALIALKEWKLTEELQRWAREELDLLEERREAMFRGMLSSLVAGDLKGKFITPLMEAVKRQKGWLTKDGKITPTKHRQVWEWLKLGLEKLQPELCVLFLEARGIPSQEEISWFLRRYAKELAKVSFAASRAKTVMGTEEAALQSSGFWNQNSGGGAAPFAGYRFSSTSPFGLFDAWQAGITYQPPAEWGFGLAVLAAMEGNVFAHAPSIFGSHGFKPVGSVLRWFAIRKGLALRGAEDGWKWFQTFSRIGIPLENIPPHFRKGDGKHFRLRQTKQAMGFSMALEEPMENANEREVVRHAVPPVFADFLSKREQVLRESITEDWKDRSRGKDWSLDWIEKRIESDLKDRIEEMRPHLEASFGAERGFGLAYGEEDQYDEEDTSYDGF